MVDERLNAIFQRVKTARLQIETELAQQQKPSLVECAMHLGAALAYYKASTMAAFAGNKQLAQELKALGDSEVKEYIDLGCDKL